MFQEGSIEDLKKPENSNDGKAYFGTITELCAKYGKPIIYLDSRSFLAIFAESITSQLGVVLGGMASFKIIKPDMTKRSFAKYSLITALGAYAFLGGFSSMPLKSMLAERLYPPDELMRRLFEAEPYFFSHIVDQRNVQITSRLKQLPGILPAEDFNNGDYILATFGAAHIIGIDFYLRNPAIHKVKSAAYAANYDLIDSDEIAKYVSKGANGQKWFFRE